MRRFATTLSNVGTGFRFTELGISTTLSMLTSCRVCLPMEEAPPRAVAATFSSASLSLIDVEYVSQILSRESTLKLATRRVTCFCPKVTSEMCATTFSHIF